MQQIAFVPLIFHPAPDPGLSGFAEAAGMYSLVTWLWIWPCDLLGRWAEAEVAGRQLQE